MLHTARYLRSMRVVGVEQGGSKGVGRLLRNIHVSLLVQEIPKLAREQRKAQGV